MHSNTLVLNEVLFMWIINVNNVWKQTDGFLGSDKVFFPPCSYKWTMRGKEKGLFFDTAQGFYSGMCSFEREMNKERYLASQMRSRAQSEEKFLSWPLHYILQILASAQSLALLYETKNNCDARVFLNSQDSTGLADSTA